MGVSATGAMADEAPKAEAPTTAPKAKALKKKKAKKKIHKGHKFHADHKLAEVEEAPPAPPPAPPVVEPPPAVVEQPPPPPPIVKHEDDSGFYAGVGAGTFRVDVTGLNVNGAGANFRLAGSEFGAYGNVGYNFNKYAAVELRAGGVQTLSQGYEGAGLLGANVSIPSVFNADTDGFQSAFFKGTIPIGSTWGVYGLIGATHGVVDTSTNVGALSYRDDYNDGDVSYGAGVQANVGKSLVLGAEWVRYIDDNDGGVVATLEGTVGRVQYKF